MNNRLAELLLTCLKRLHNFLKVNVPSDGMCALAFSKNPIVYIRLIVFPINSIINYQYLKKTCFIENKKALSGTPT